ncbi:hypothetical protein A8709_26005 [Paenibacillus pectinilyticus]|uniref:FHA domain-containing protein n=1 Tax=Paenibacillus pectinilyticus TaxID=512399 RepID=A0A1C1A182_9BACL|nr:DUF6382 domain-containing protein [Paenibacillus pectinilyticus]OCT14285.1 hypothetical protein A8709_26005 [Paenibacillus pectinilyticus]
MTQEIFGLHYEFMYRHGHYMDLYKDPGLDSNALCSLQLRMLEANQIPRLLPLDIHEVDSQIRLQYQLSSKRMLSHVLKVESFTLQQFAKLMFAIISTLEDSKNYMLVEANHILKDNFIFVGADLSDIYLTYVPLQLQHEVTDVYPLLDQLISKLAAHIVESEQERIPTWIVSTPKSSMKSLQAYKEVLLGLMDGPALEKNHSIGAAASILPLEQQVINPLKPISIMDHANEIVEPAPPESGLPRPHWKCETNKPAPSIRLAEAKPEAQSMLNQHASQREAKTTTVNKTLITFIPLHQREKWIVIAVLLIVSAFLWQQYFIYLSSSLFQITAGVTLLLGDIGFVLLKWGRPRFLDKVDAKLQAAAEFSTTYPDPFALNTTYSTAEVTSNIEQYYQDLPMHTTLLSPANPNATVFLGNSKTQPTGPRLEVKEEGADKSIPITNDPFIIGRGDTNLKVDYVIDIAGVSRVHAEIVRTSQGYQLRDAGSTNGTFLNEGAMVTYQAYPLKDGDVVRIIRQEMTFRV